MVIRHLSMASILALNGCPGSVDHYKARIKDISVSITRDGRPLVDLPAQNYLQNQNDKNTLLFTTFSLQPGEEWAHIINLLNFFNRDEENAYRRLEANMLADFRAKKDTVADDRQSPLEIEEQLVQPFHTFFAERFIWHAGEYQLAVNVTTDKNEANVLKNYRFTVFESHEEQLKEITQHYKYGGGIWWDPNIQTNVILDVKEA
ncbi:hypothetical protein RTH74_21965 [Pseudomonas sp. zfem001]|uniref:hypothetical protein n=1 Tax=Pseudomonas sp. zfem001 TaxID=3078196 RepID=UPI0029280F5A|nr:hypothetical protein [Pseudomonas sp. zfem001]MDU9410277.1 hypothetical protein [Pseudomonas sp. zfem001]